MKKNLVKLSSGNNASRSFGFGGGYSGCDFLVHRHSKSCLLSSRYSPLILVMFAGDFPLLMMFDLNSRRVVVLQANVLCPWEIIIQALSSAIWTSFCFRKVCHCKYSRKRVRIATTACTIAEFWLNEETICTSEAPSAFSTDAQPGVAVKTGTAVTEGVAVGTGAGGAATGVTVRDSRDKLCEGLEEGVALGSLSSWLGVGVELLSSPLPPSASLVANEKKENANAVRIIRGKSTNLLMTLEIPAAGSLNRLRDRRWKQLSRLDRLA